jgi:hypothetical protein
VTLLTNSFAGGSNGVAITTVNSGGTSGDAFNAVAGTLVYDSTYAIHSTLSAHGSNTGTNAARVRWSSSLGTVTQAWFRIYGYFTAYPASHVVIFSCDNFSLFMKHSGAGQGLLYAQDGNNNIMISDTTTALPSGAWWRVEGYCIASTTVGAAQIKVFVTGADSSTPDETKTSTSAWNTGASITQANYGICGWAGGGGTWDLWWDALGASDTAYIGPVVSGTNAVPGLASATGTALVPVGVATSALVYGGAASGLAGGTGTWVNPGNAAGPDDSTYATWAVP